MQVLKGKGFHIVYMLKMGSTSLSRWPVREQDLTRMSYPLEYFKNADPTDPIYAVWRPPLERVISGVLTGLIVRSQSAKEPIEKHVAEWLRNPTVGKPGITSHTKLVKNVYKKHDYQSWNWFHLSQLGSLHTYLNNKHGTSMKEVPKLNSHDSPQDLFFGEDWQNRYPKVIKMLREYVANDYIPENFLDLED